MTFLKSSVKTEYFEYENQLINCAKRLENNSSKIFPTATTVNQTNQLFLEDIIY